MSNWAPAAPAEDAWAQQLSTMPAWASSAAPASAWVASGAAAPAWAPASLAADEWGYDDMTSFIQRSDTSGPPAIAYKKLYEYDAAMRLIYEGWARAGTAETDPFWVVKKFTYDAGGAITAELWADGNALEDNIWANRNVLNYS